MVEEFAALNALQTVVVDEKNAAATVVVVAAGIINRIPPRSCSVLVLFFEENAAVRFNARLITMLLLDLDVDITALESIPSS